MYRQRGYSFWLCCGVISATLACATNAHAELLGYWSANDNSDPFLLPNDQGNSGLDGELFGLAAYTDGGLGVTGAAGDRALEFGGVDEDYAELPMSEDVTFQEITLTAWLKGEQTGDWSGIFQSRGSTPIGMGYGGGSGNLTYTWNDNSADSWNFGATQPQLNIPVDEWTFVALTVEPDNATLYVGPKGGTLESATNEIPHLAQLPTANWRLSEDDCCGTARNFLGLMDDAAIWNHRLTGAQLAEIHSGAKLPTDPSFAERVAGLRQVQVAGSGLGTDELGGTLSNVVKGEPVESAGLAQYWFDGNMRGATAVENYLGVGETGNEQFPLATAGPFAHAQSTWWSGSDTLTVNGEALPKYPSPGLAGTRFDGSGNEENYGVILRGEVFIEKDGEVLIRDGIDDFAMVAIDQDGNGELDALADLLDADVGSLGPFNNIDDVLILDDAWSTVRGGNQTEAEHAIANFENVGADGDWRAIQVWMGEAGGGDGATLFMGDLDDPDLFSELDGADLTPDQIDKFLVPNDRLRSSIAQVESADAQAALATNVEYVLQVAADGSSDQVAIDNNGGIYTTTLDVTGATILIDAAEGIADGTSFQIFSADNIVGADQLTLNGIDLSVWTFNPATGELTFGMPGGDFLEADFNQDGIVNFTDFLVLSTQFNQTVDPPGTPPDINGDGTVNFPDFLVLSTQFNMTSGGAEAVPEPSGLALFGVAGLIVGLLRRRRS